MENTPHTIEYDYVDTVTRAVKWPIRAVKVDSAQFQWPLPDGTSPDADEIYRRKKLFEKELVEEQEELDRHVVVFGVTSYFPKEWDNAVEPLMIADFKDVWRKTTLEVNIL